MASRGLGLLLLPIAGHGEPRLEVHELQGFTMSSMYRSYLRPSMTNYMKLRAPSKPCLSDSDKGAAGGGSFPSLCGCLQPPWGNAEGQHS